jgi:hypothetical protein
VERVVARTAVDAIRPLVAEQAVVAGKAADAVPAAQAADQVAGRRADQVVAPGGAVWLQRPSRLPSAAWFASSPCWSSLPSPSAVAAMQSR